MKQLMLMRHGKSDWNYGLDDFDRPLANRGRADAPKVAQEIIPILPSPIVIQSSTARRAADTALLVAAHIQYPIDAIIWRDELYTFDEIRLESIVRSLDDDHENVILFGHNEAITNFVNKFGSIYIDNVPTCGFVSLVFEISGWSQLKKGSIKNVVFPRDLKA